MSQPLYYLPKINRQRVRPDQGQLNLTLLTELGLGSIFSDCNSLTVRAGDVTSGGPDGGSGVIICYQTPKGSIPDRDGYVPSQQTWHDCGEFWIGLDNNSPVVPEDLVRESQNDGYAIALGGREYVVPVVRREDDTTLLPRDIQLNPAREVLKAQFQKNWDDSAEVIEWAQNNSWPKELDGVAHAVELAVSVLGINYRYGVHEHNAIGLIDSTNWLKVLVCSSDFPKLKEIDESQKKTESPTLGLVNGSPTPEDSSPDTSLVGQT